MKRAVLPFACFIAAVLAPSSAALAASSFKEATKRSYSATGKTSGLVLFDIYWARVWGCGAYENVQLRSLEFDRVATDGAEPVTLVLNNPARLTAPRQFVQYAVLLEPGHYQLAAFEVGFAKSTSDIGVYKADRADLLTAGQSRAGHFSVAAGESVYIGNWAVDCAVTPMPWRFYSEGRTVFAGHLEQYKAKYPFLETDRVVYRLFETTELGYPYKLK